MLLHDVSKAFLTNEMLAFNAQLHLQAINKSEQKNVCAPISTEAGNRRFHFTLKVAQSNGSVMRSTPFLKAQN